MVFHDITPLQIRKLGQTTATPALSFYIPTARSGADVLKGRAMLKNLLTEAENRLTDAGMRHTLVLDFLRNVAEIGDDDGFWNDRLDAVAIFIAPGFLEVYHLPFTTPLSLHIGSHFQIRPLLGALLNRKSYFVLALDKNDVRLVQCGLADSRPVNIPEMPSSLDSFVGPAYSEKQTQYHSAGPSGRAGSAISHGAGDKGAEEKDQVHRFVQAIAKSVEKHLAASQASLVLLGTEELMAAYRSVSEYPHLLQTGVQGSPKMLGAEGLKVATVDIVADLMDDAKREQIERYKEYLDTGLASQQIDEILVAAIDGKVDVLLADEEAYRWGIYDADTRRVVSHPQAAEGDEDLLNLAAVETLKNSGTVFPVRPEDLTLSEGLGAIFRY